MSTSPADQRPFARSVRVTDDQLAVELVDGRVLLVPLAWFPRLLNATPDARNKWVLLGDGEGIHWPDADEDLSVEGLLMGNRARGAA